MIDYTIDQSDDRFHAGKHTFLGKNHTTSKNRKTESPCSTLSIPELTSLSVIYKRWILLYTTAFPKWNWYWNFFRIHSKLFFHISWNKLMFTGDLKAEIQAIAYRVGNWVGPVPCIFHIVHSARQPFSVNNGENWTKWLFNDHISISRPALNTKRFFFRSFNLCLN